MTFERIDNATPMEAHGEVLDDRHGREVLTVIAKMSWEVSSGGAVAVARRPSPIRQSDEWTGEPIASSLRFPSDLWPEKPGTDVLLVGTARPPWDRAITSLDVGLRVGGKHGPLQKTARVYGPRVFYAGIGGVVPGAPGRLGPTPLVYERAYGGEDEEHNPIGTGAARAPGALVGKEAPAIEDPARPLTSRSPAPVGFGAIPPHWAPRSLFAGTHDEAWKRDRAPLPPADRDPRFYSCAPPGQWTAEPLFGDEPIQVMGATPEGLWLFQLPRYAPVFSCVVRGAARECPTHLDTVIIDADAGRVELTYRISIPVPRRVQLIDRVRIEGSAPLHDEALAAPEEETR